MPDEGPMTFEFDIEVRPEFDLPNWKGLNVERPMREFTEKDVDQQMQRLLAQRGRLVPFEGAAEAGDYMSVNITFKDGENVISQTEEQTLCIRPTLSFRDGKIEKFDKLMAGVKAGETREAKAKLSDRRTERSAARQNNHRRVRSAGSQEAGTARIDRRRSWKSWAVSNRKRNCERPCARNSSGSWNITSSSGPGSKLRRRWSPAPTGNCRRRLAASGKAAASWNGPCWNCAAAGLATSRFAPTKTNLRQNSLSATARALKEHFILERIAEDEKIEDEPTDYEAEIRLIADQSGESVRRVRAQLEKRGLMDILRNQIIERKTIDLVLKHAKFKDVPYQARVAGDRSGRRSGRRRRGNRGCHSRGETRRRSRAPTRNARNGRIELGVGRLVTNVSECLDGPVRTASARQRTDAQATRLADTDRKQGRLHESSSLRPIRRFDRIGGDRSATELPRLSAAAECSRWAICCWKTALFCCKAKFTTATPAKW